MDRALRDDDSLFTPGEQIWSSQWLGELRERFLEQPAVERESDFLPELERQLAGSPPEVYQVMAEALYVHYLIQSMRPETKLGKIQRVLGWSPKPVSIPQPPDYRSAGWVRQRYSRVCQQAHQLSIRNAH